MAETISIKRTIKHTDEQGNEIAPETVIETEFDVEWPTQRDEQYENFFENEAAMWENELRGLQTKIKQAAGSYIISNESADGLQEYMDNYQISTRSHGGGRRKEVKITDEALEEAGVSKEQMEQLASALGLKLVAGDDE